MMKTNQSSKILIVSLIGILIYTFSQLFIILFVSFLLIVALLPLVRFLKAKKIPKTVSVLCILFLLIGLSSFLFLQIIPVITEQSSLFIQGIPDIIREAARSLGVPDNWSIVNFITQHTGQIIQQALMLSGTVVTVVSSLLIIMTLVIYGVIYYDQTSRSILGIFARTNKNRHYEKLLKNIEERLGAWITGQLSLSFIIGGLAWLIYTVIGLPFAGLLAVIAGFFEIIPNIGPAIGAIPALLIALSISPETFLWTLGVYIAIQALESYLIAPKIMSKAVRLNPFIIITVLLAGAHTLGLVGALVAIPLTVAVIEIYKFSVERKEVA
ncbi:MAG TPA: AI-2E family transporter [Candidatus Saccharimonadales bacterium]